MRCPCRSSGSPASRPTTSPVRLPSPRPTSSCSPSPATPWSSARTSPSTSPCWARRRRAAARRRRPPAASTRCSASLLLLPEADRHGLGALGALLDLGETPHRALADVRATAGLLAELRERAAELSETERRLLHAAAWQPLALLEGCERAPSRARRVCPAAAPGPASPAPAAAADGRPATLACAAEGWRAAFERDGALAAGLPGLRRATRPDRPGRRGGHPPLETAASACSRPAPAWARASPTCCRPPIGPPPAALGSPSAPRPRPCSASSPNASSPWSRAACPRGFAGRCSWAVRTTSAGAGSTRRSPPAARACPTATVCSPWPGSQGAFVAARSTSRRCPTALPRPCPPWPRPRASCVPAPRPVSAVAARRVPPAPGGWPAARPARPTSSASITPCC